MAKLTLLRTMLDVRNLPETIAFYRDKLGFELWGTYPPDDPNPGWAQVHRDDVWLMFTYSEPHEHDDDGGEPHSHDPALNGCLYVNVDDVDALHTELTATLDPESLIHPPTDQPHGMREFAITDPNGFVVVFGMPLTTG